MVKAVRRINLSVITEAPSPDRLSGLPGGAEGKWVAKVCSAGVMTGPSGPGAIKIPQIGMNFNDFTGQSNEVFELTVSKISLNRTTS